MGINKQKYFNYVKDFFTENGCELLNTFESFVDRNESNLNFKCRCGNIEENINFKWYSRAVHKACTNCQKSNHSRRNKEFLAIVAYFKENGCNLLTNKRDYVNSTTKNLKYECKCGEIVENESYQLYFLSTYKCCQNCRNLVMEHRYTPFADVKKIFDEKDVELLTTEKEYIGANVTKFKYKCQCGETVQNVSYHSFILSKYKQCNECVKRLIKKTCLERYGYENPMQNSVILDTAIKKQYNLKDFTFPSGTTIQVQGYEDLALKILLEEKYKEDDIITSRTLMPTFSYAVKNKVRKYLPDIFIKSENKIIEVKSNRTFNVQRVQNMLKALSVRKAGYDFEFWIFYKVLKSDTPNYKYKKSILKLYKM